MKTLVLGGTGFVGRRLVEILTADGVVRQWCLPGHRRRQ